MIGDGMGVSQLSSGREVVTQSSAAATALATGYKTYNAAIGVDLDTVVRENIVEILSRQGYMAGVIATSHITDATPAGFYAHQADRYMQEEIAYDLLNSEIDFFAGGGSEFFRDSSGAFPFEEHGIEINYSKLKKIRKPEEGNNSYGTSDYSVITPTFASTNHSAALVPVFSFGPGAENFIGVYENTEIFHKLVSLMESE